MLNVIFTRKKRNLARNASIFLCELSGPFTSMMTNFSISYRMQLFFSLFFLYLFLCLLHFSIMVGKWKRFAVKAKKNGMKHGTIDSINDGCIIAVRNGCVENRTCDAIYCSIQTSLSTDDSVIDRKSVV